MIDLINIGKNARAAVPALAILSEEQKNQALRTLAHALLEKQDRIIQANQLDIQEAQLAGLSLAMIDRLRLDADRIQGISKDVETVVALSDPVGKLFDQKVMPNGLKVHKQRVPVGVLAVIYESRPNVTIDVAALALKSGNAVILRGGKETLHSNRILVEIINETFQGCRLPENSVQFIDSADREVVHQLVKMHAYIDMLIPRGGKTLHQYCRENSTIPVIIGGIGVCHLFVDDSADFAAAVRVIHNAKTQRPTVCNALDTVLIHEEIADQFLPMLISVMTNSGVACKLDPQAWEKTPMDTRLLVEMAGEEDFDQEWLSLVLGIKVVKNLEEAISHIQAHSTGHSDGILTQTDEHAAQFVQRVDSAVVYVNASTRFTDGSQLGLGAEVAVSTQRLHARGPLALEELTTYKWVVQGDYHVRA